MNESRLRELLREAPLPGGAEAERRGLAVVEAAFAERERGPREGAPVRARGKRRAVSLPRLALVLAIATLLVALLLSPAGAAVRDWVGDVFTDPPRPQPGLAETPGGGRLLVQSADGPWVVQPDGSRRLLGDFREAAWSPRGLFVATVAGRDLSALEPDGTPRWTITAPRRVFGPRWSPIRGDRIAYRSGSTLRVTAADGTEDRLLDPRVASVSPAWSPYDPYRLAYVDARGELWIADTESGESTGAGIALPALAELDWAGNFILEASRTTLGLRPVKVDKLAGKTEVGTTRIGLPLPPGSEVLDAALAPNGKRVAAVVRLGEGAERTAVLLYEPRQAPPPRRLFLASGRLTELTWAPDSSRLLVAWPRFDWWLFLPVGRGSPRGVSGVAAAFTPGERGATFPRVEGWCCAR